MEPEKSFRATEKPISAADKAESFVEKKLDGIIGNEADSIWGELNFQILRLQEENKPVHPDLQAVRDGVGWIKQRYEKKNEVPGKSPDISEDQLARELDSEIDGIQQLLYQTELQLPQSAELFDRMKQVVLALRNKVTPLNEKITGFKNVLGTLSEQLEHGQITNEIFFECKNAIQQKFFCLTYGVKEVGEKKREQDPRVAFIEYIAEKDELLERQQEIAYLRQVRAEFSSNGDETLIGAEEGTEEDLERACIDSLYEKLSHPRIPEADKDQFLNEFVRAQLGPQKFTSPQQPEITPEHGVDVKALSKLDKAEIMLAFYAHDRLGIVRDPGVDHAAVVRSANTFRAVVDASERRPIHDTRNAVIVGAACLGLLLAEAQRVYDRGSTTNRPNIPFLESQMRRALDDWDMHKGMGALFGSEKVRNLAERAQHTISVIETSSLPASTKVLLVDDIVGGFSPGLFLAPDGTQVQRFETDFDRRLQLVEAKFHAVFATEGGDIPEGAQPEEGGLAYLEKEIGYLTLAATEGIVLYRERVLENKDQFFKKCKSQLDWIAYYEQKEDAKHDTRRQEKMKQLRLQVEQAERVFIQHLVQDGMRKGFVENTKAGQEYRRMPTYKQLEAMAGYYTAAKRSLTEKIQRLKGQQARGFTLNRGEQRISWGEIQASPEFKIMSRALAESNLLFQAELANSPTYQGMQERMSAGSFRTEFLAHLESLRGQTITLNDAEIACAEVLLAEVDFTEHGEECRLVANTAVHDGFANGVRFDTGENAELLTATIAGSADPNIDIYAPQHSVVNGGGVRRFGRTQMAERAKSFVMDAALIEEVRGLMQVRDGAIVFPPGRSFETMSKVCAVVAHHEWLAAQIASGGFGLNGSVVKYLHVGAQYEGVKGRIGDMRFLPATVKELQFILENHPAERVFPVFPPGIDHQHISAFASLDRIMAANTADTLHGRNPKAMPIFVNTFLDDIELGGEMVSPALGTHGAERSFVAPPPMNHAQTLLEMEQYRRFRHAVFPGPKSKAPKHTPRSALK